MTLSGANCRSTYHGELLGYRDYTCTHGRGDFSQAVVLDAHGDASILDARLRHKGTDYARAHVTRLPIVVLAREGRAWGLYRPFQQVHLDARDSALWVFQLGFFAYWALAGAALIGATILRRRGVALWPLVVFIVIVAIAVATSFGYTRYRAPADVPIVLLAAVAIDAGIARLHARRHNSPRWSQEVAPEPDADSLAVQNANP